MGCLYLKTVSANGKSLSMNKITIFENAYLRIFQYAIFGYSFYKFPKFYFLYLENMKLSNFKNSNIVY